MSLEQANVAPSSNHTQPKHFLLLFIGIFSFVIVLTVFGLMMYQKYSTMQNPDTVLGNVQQVIRAVQTTSYRAEADIVVNAKKKDSVPGLNLSTSLPRNNSTSTVHIEIGGSIDLQNSSAAESAIHVNVKFQPDDSTVLAYDADGIFVQGLQYIKLNTMPPAGFFDHSEVKKSWIRVNTKDMNDADLLTMITGEWGDDFLFYQNFASQIPYFIKRLFGEPLVSKEKMSQEVVEHATVYRFPYILQKKDLEDILMNIPNGIISESKNDQKYLNVSKDLSDVEIYGDVWVDAKNYYPQKMSVYFEEKEKNSSIVKIKGSLVIYFDTFNATINIAPPQDSIDLQTQFEYFDTNSLISLLQQADPAYDAYVKQAQDPTFKRNEKRFQDLRQLSVALLLYQNDNDMFPLAPAGIFLGKFSTICLNSPIKREGVSGFTSADNCSYPIMSTVSGDPLQGSVYLYTTDDGGTTFTIEAILEGDYVYGKKTYSGKIHATPDGILDVPETDPGE